MYAFQNVKELASSPELGVVIAVVSMNGRWLK